MLLVYLKIQLLFHGSASPSSIPHPSSFINLKFRTPTLTLQKLFSLHLQGPKSKPMEPKKILYKKCIALYMETIFTGFVQAEHAGSQKEVF